MAIVKVEVANFEGRDGEVVDMVKLGGNGKAIRASKLLDAMLADNRDEIIAICREAISAAAPKKSATKTTSSTPAAPAPPAPTYYGFTGTGDAMPLSKGAAIEFCAAHANNPEACIYVNDTWHHKGAWVSLGLMPPSVPKPEVPTTPCPPVPEVKKGLAAMCNSK